MIITFGDKLTWFTYKDFLPCLYVANQKTNRYVGKREDGTFCKAEGDVTQYMQEVYKTPLWRLSLEEREWLK